MALLKMTSKILATSNKLSFYAGRDSSCYLLLDSDISKKYSWSYPQRGWRNLGFVIFGRHKGLEEEEYIYL